jgi:hypothetical protein
LAILAGVNRAEGQHIFFVDSDLEEAPELVKEFLSIMGASGADVVSGANRYGLRFVTRVRQDGWKVLFHRSDVGIGP